MEASSPDIRLGMLMTAGAVRVQNARIEREDRGAAMAEYGLLIAFVALAVMGILFTFGSSLKTTFGFASDTLSNSPALSNTSSTSN